MFSVQNVCTQTNSVFKVIMNTLSDFTKLQTVFSFCQILYMASFFYTLNYVWNLYTGIREKFYSCISGYPVQVHANHHTPLLTVHNKVQWWSVTLVMVLVLYLSFSILYYFILLLHHISEINILLFTPLHLSDSFSYFTDYSFSCPSCPVKTT